MNITRLTNCLRRPHAARQPIRKADNRRLRTELLENRDAPAIFTVTWDGKPAGPAEPVGAMTLQQAIAAANVTAGPNQINYGNTFGTNAPVAQSFVLSAASANQNNGPLPAIQNQTLVIDGTEAGGVVADINVVLQSSAAVIVVNGFDIKTAGAANSIIRNMKSYEPGAPNNFSAPASGEYGVKIETPGGGVS